MRIWKFSDRDDYDRSQQNYGFNEAWIHRWFSFPSDVFYDFNTKFTWRGLQQHGRARRASKKLQKGSKSEKINGHFSIQYQFDQSSRS